MPDRVRRPGRRRGPERRTTADPRREQPQRRVGRLPRAQDDPRRAHARPGRSPRRPDRREDQIGAPRRGRDRGAGASASGRRVTVWNPAVSVVVCAYTQRRWGDLQDAVDSALLQPEATEVVVVIDHEPELLRMTQTRWPHLTVVANRGPQGLSGARNTGMHVAYGDVVAFLDDDATAAEDWLRHLVAPFTDPKVIAVGGRAEPVWPAGARSAMYPDELLWIVGCSHRGLPEELAEVRNVLGCSMAFRRRPALAAGGFDTDTGRVGAVPLGGEETELCIRLRQQDPEARILLDPRAVVHHRVSADRATWSYVRSRSYHEGISKAILGRKLGREDALSSETAYAAHVLPAALVRELGQVGRGGARRIAAIALMAAATIAGYLRAARATPTLGAATVLPSVPMVTGPASSVPALPSVGLEARHPSASQLRGEVVSG
ncbi:glycosyltransferase family 2 protein [Curtobacterium sp. MCBD17_028]|nr:glycosyltransferase family 2 protein [Curtobacterium sp. MCBD17_028]